MEQMPMKWSEISIETTNEAVEPISNILHENGASGVVIEDVIDLTKEREDQFGEIYALNPNDFPEDGVIIKAYLLKNDSIETVIETIKQQIALLTTYEIDIGPNQVSTVDVQEEDWATAWKQYYHPVKISETFTIVPTWEQYEVSENEKIIELDPGMAFGTGTHPTTFMCIQALERTVKKDDVVIDVGTGSGVLSIAAALLDAKKVVGVDLDEVAVKSATDNVALNHVQSKVEIVHGDLLQGSKDPVDVIVANILAEVILLFVDDAAKKVKKGGYFITSGIIVQKKDAVQETLANAGFMIEEVMQEEDWICIIAKRQ